MSKTSKSLLHLHLQEAIKAAKASFKFCPESFTDKKGRLWTRSLTPVESNGPDVWHYYDCEDVEDWAFNLFYEDKKIIESQEGSIVCIAYFNSGEHEGDEFTEFRCGWDPLSENDLKALVSKCEKAFRNMV